MVVRMCFPAGVNFSGKVNSWNKLQWTLLWPDFVWNVVTPVLSLISLEIYRGLYGSSKDCPSESWGDSTQQAGQIVNDTEDPFSTRLLKRQSLKHKKYCHPSLFLISYGLFVLFLNWFLLFLELNSPMSQSTLEKSSVNILKTYMKNISYRFEMNWGWINNGRFIFV